MLFQTDSKPTNTCGCPAVNNVDVGGTRLRVENAWRKWTLQVGPLQLHDCCFADSSKENRLQQHSFHRLYTRDLDGGHSQKWACLACSFFIGCAPVSRHFSSSFLIGSETKNGLAKSSTGSAKQTRF